jgi:hypothetical protein
LCQSLSHNLYQRGPLWDAPQLQRFRGRRGRSEPQNSPTRAIQSSWATLASRSHRIAREARPRTRPPPGRLRARNPGEFRAAAQSSQSAAARSCPRDNAVREHHRRGSRIGNPGGPAAPCVHRRAGEHVQARGTAKSGCSRRQQKWNLPAHSDQRLAKCTHEEGLARAGETTRHAIGDR